VQRFASENTDADCRTDVAPSDLAEPDTLDCEQDPDGRRCHRVGEGGATAPKGGEAAAPRERWRDHARSEVVLAPEMHEDADQERHHAEK
jgi:hypothetical protein